MIEVRDTQAYESIGVSGDRDAFNELGQVDEGAVDVVDLGCALEAKLRESLNSIAELRVVDDGLVTQDDPEVLQPIDPALRRRRRKSYLPSDVTCRTTARRLQKVSKWSGTRRCVKRWPAGAGVRGAG